MHEQTKAKMMNWLNKFPESSHPLDEERFYSFVLTAYYEKDNITFLDLFNAINAVKTDWNNSFKTDFCEEKEVLIANLLRFYKYAENISKEHKSDAKSFQDFLNQCMRLNPYELFDLVHILKGQTDSSAYFSIDRMEDQSKYRIKYPITDASILLDANKEKDFISYIEQVYMDGLDADEWYGSLQGHITL